MILKNKVESELWAKTFAQTLKRPTVVRLDGDLGAGKTQFARWMLEALGANDAASPTFAIHHAYPLLGGDVDHLDLYRLASDEDLEGTGFWDLLENPHALMLVEWAERLPDEVWPKHWTSIGIRIKALGEGEEREIVARTIPAEP